MKKLPQALIRLNDAYEALRHATANSDHPSIIDAMTLVSHIADDVAGHEDSLKKLREFNVAVERVLGS